MPSENSLERRLVAAHLSTVALTYASVVLALFFTLTFAVWPREDSPQAAIDEAGDVSEAIRELGSGLDSNILRAMVDPNFHVVYQPGYGPPLGWRSPTLRNVTYIVVLNNNQQVVASSDSAGHAFNPPEHDELVALARRTVSEAFSMRGLVSVRSGPGPSALVAFPMLGVQGTPDTAVILGLSRAPANGPYVDLPLMAASLGRDGLEILVVCGLAALGLSMLIARALARRAAAGAE